MNCLCSYSRSDHRVHFARGIRILRFVCAALVAIQLACSTVAMAQLAQQDFPELKSSDWPWWRGGQRNGLAEGSPPLRFGAAENIAWKVPLPGRGHSSPIVVNDQVFLATADEAQQVHAVVAMDLKTGRQLWTREISQGGFPRENHPKNTEASPTLASDGERLFVTFFHHQRVVLSALSLEGQTEWESVVSPFNPKQYKYGYAPSPVLYGNSVIVVAEHDGPSGLVAFDRRSGKVLWQTPRKPNITFSSPVVANLSGRDQLLISGSETVDAYDPRNGKPLWSVPGTTSATCGTMVWHDQLVFASGGYPKPETIAVVADGSGRIAWKNNLKCYEQSMIVVDGYLYGLTDAGILYCWRASDGREMWRERLSGPVSASPVYAGGHIYWANEKGTMYVFKPNPEQFELVAENRLGDESFASPAVVGDRLLLRIAEGRKPNRQEYLICVGQ